MLPEGPEFVFGGAVALLAFLWLGSGPGLLATAVSLSALWFLRGTAAVVTVVYVLEVWLVCGLYRRVGSLVAASAIYWLTAGWVLDRLLYGGILGLQTPFLMLLLVKQLLNGFINAAVAEAVFWFLRTRLPIAVGREVPTERLQLYLFRRVLFVVLLPLFGLTFLYAGVSYERRVDAARADQLRTAGDLRLQVEALALAQNEALVRLGRLTEMARAKGETDAQGLIEEFAGKHPEFTAVGVTDRDGQVTAAVPKRLPSGESLLGDSMAKRRFFSQARLLMRMASVPQLLGVDGEGSRARPILVMTPPLIDAAGGFDGIVFGVIGHDRIRSVLRRVRTPHGQLPTLITSDFRVIASLDPKMPPGESLEARLPIQRLSGSETALFEYFPPKDGTWDSRLQMDMRYAAFQAIPAFDLAALVDLPIQSLQEQMLGVTFSAIGVLTSTLALAFLVAVLVSRHIARPLARVNVISRDIAGGRFPGPAPLLELGQSGIEEIRGLGTHLRTMQEGLMEYRELSAARERESEERFSATFRQAAVGIAHLDADLRWQRVNGRLCTIVGVPAETLLGRPMNERLHPDDREPTERVFRAMLAGERDSGGLEARYRRPDGGSAVTQLTVSLVREDDGSPKYFILVMEDIANRKRLEMELMQAQKMESVGRLAGGVAHDFNNLLTAILGYGEMLAQRLAGDARSLADLHQIQQAGERASRLTRQLLAFARRQVIEPRSLSLNDLVRNMEHMLRRLIGEHIEFECRLDEELECVRADPGQLEQVILNLAVNARDAMADGGRLTLSTGMAAVPEGPRPHLSLSPGKYVTLTVTDTGEGMSEDVRRHIFEPFFTTKEKEQGTGLGLATCYGIVQQSGGDIDVTSEPGKGASFCVSLPAVGPRAAVEGERRPAAASGGRETVLLVEDEPGVARMARQALQAHGYQVLLASDGREALALLEQNQARPDLLLTDVVMPHMGGSELAARLREALPGLKILFTSGYSYDGFGGRAELLPGTSFLQKPFTPTALARAVRTTLDDHREAAGT